MVTREEMRRFVWGQVLMLTSEKKTKFRDGKYAAYKEMWEELGGDLDGVCSTDSERREARADETGTPETE